MRKTVPMRIGELWSDFVAGTPTVARKMGEARVAELWPQIVGPAVAAHTLSVAVEKGVLQVRMSSSVARHELFMRREQLCAAVNEAVGMTVVRSAFIK